MFTLPQAWRGKFGSGPEHLLCELVQREGVEYGVWTSAKLFKSGMSYWFIKHFATFLNVVFFILKASN